MRTVFCIFKEDLIMKTVFYKSPIGFLEIDEDDGALTAISFLGDICQEKNCDSSPLLSEAVKQLDEYFAGERKEFSLPLKFAASEFYTKVWEELRKVEYGKTVTYGQLAKLAGSEKAARAVGSAMRKNPFVIVVPCHRVLPTGGKLGNYSAGGAANKDWLLTFEKQNTEMSSDDIFMNIILGVQ